LTESTPPIPDAFARTTRHIHGTAGEEWLQRLPGLLRDCAERWSLIVGPPFEPLTYNYVAPAELADGTEAVLKAGVSGPEILREIEALRACAGEGTVRLLAADRAQGVFLLERVTPGRPLSEVKEEEKAVSIACSVMRRMWRPVPPDGPFLSVAEWAAGLQRLRDRFDGGTGLLPVVLVERAEGLFADLLSSMDEPVLLHGDLHHYNILASGREDWLAIDPKGVTGEPAYEIGPFLYNPHGIGQRPSLRELLARRIDQFSAELGIDRRRLQAWGFAQAVLSAWWILEDYGRGWEGAIAVAEALV
jgi:streptomycin 6-kinase